MDGPMTYIIIGAGSRGTVYAKYALENPHLAKVVGVAEPREFFRNLMAKQHVIPEENTAADWKEIAARPKFADAVCICTQDQMHRDPVIAFSKLGYAVLCEKPMAVSEQDCHDIVSEIVKNKTIFAIGHVLRYTMYSQKIKELLTSGAIGEVINIQHLEPVGYYHFAHSYVRGNWRRADESSPVLMAKSCHDLDWLRYMMGVRCLSVSSFGSLTHFKKENKPQEALGATRCLDCPAKDTCAYSAKRIYLDTVAFGHTGWPVKVIVPDDLPDIENVTKALKEGPYGRCAYECDNDVNDHQVVNFIFEGGKTASFTMVAFTKEICIRKTRIFGTLGEMECDGHKIQLFDFKTRTAKVFYPDDPSLRTEMSGHGYGDYYLMKSFVEAVRANDKSLILSGPEETLESHLLVFAAEKARLEHRVVDIEPLQFN